MPLQPQPASSPLNAAAAAVRASNSWEAWGPSAGADSALNASTCSIASIASVVRGGVGQHAKTPSGNGPDRIHVYVRPRPMHTNASADGLPGEQVSIYADTEARTINITAEATSKTIPCDGAFDRAATQAEVYAAVGTRFVTPLLEGLSGCIFAYGQTGSGKTFCINGGSGEGDAGIIPRMLDDVFRAASEHSATGATKREFFVESLEIYDDKLYDLLAASASPNSTSAPPPRGLIISEGSSKRVVVQGLQKIPVRSSAEAKALLALAQSARSTSATAMNAQSSRSHSIFTLVCEFDSASGGRQISKLNVVDLAGSESQKQGVTEGQTRKEGNKINQSLSTLSLVIQEIQEGRQPAYRSSKLTHILRDSLCGAALTTLIATINPSVRHLATTLSTLQFAERAQSVRIDATKALAVPAMDPREMRLKFAQLQRENTELKQKISLANLTQRSQMQIPAAACMDVGPQQMTLLMQLMERESTFLEQCMQASDNNETLLNDARNQYTEVEAERDALARELAELKRIQTVPLNSGGGFKSPVRNNYATMPSVAVASAAGEWLPRSEVDAMLQEVRRKASELASIEFHAMNERSAGEHMEAIHAERDRRKAIKLELDAARSEITKLQARVVELEEVASGSALAERELLGDLEATEEKYAALQTEHLEALQSHASAMQDADEQIARLARENTDLKATVDSLQAQLAPPAKLSVQLQQQQLIHFPLSFKIQQQQQRAKTPSMQPQRAPLDTPAIVSQPQLQPVQQASHALHPSALLNSPLSPILGKGTPTRLSVLFSGEKAARASVGGGGGEVKVSSPHLSLDENAQPLATAAPFTPKQTQKVTHRLSMSPAFYVGHTAPAGSAAATQISPRHTRSHTASTQLRA